MIVIEVLQLLVVIVQSTWSIHLTDCKHKNPVYGFKITTENRQYFYIGISTYILSRELLIIYTPLVIWTMNITSFSKRLWAIKDSDKVFSDD